MQGLLSKAACKTCLDVTQIVHKQDWLREGHEQGYQVPSHFLCFLCCCSQPVLEGSSWTRARSSPLHAVDLAPHTPMPGVTTDSARSPRTAGLFPQQVKMLSWQCFPSPIKGYSHSAFPPHASPCLSKHKDNPFCLSISVLPVQLPASLAPSPSQQHCSPCYRSPVLTLVYYFCHTDEPFSLVRWSTFNPVPDFSLWMFCSYLYLFFW